MSALRVRGVKLAGRDARIEAIEIESPRAAAGRGADGKLSVAGLRIGPPPAAEAPGDAPGAAAPPPPPATAPATPGPSPTLALANLTLRDARLAWRDDAVSPPVDTEISLATRLAGLVVGRRSDPAALESELAIPGALEVLRVRGSLLLAPDEQAAALDVDAEDLRAGPFAAYLPPGTEIELAGGRFHTRIEAGAAKHAEGGFSARLAITGTELRGGPDGSARLFGAASARAIASRIDVGAGVVAIEELSLGGVDLDVERRAGGSLALLGLVAGAAAAADAPAAPAPATSPAPPSVVRRPAARRPRELAPLVTLAKLDLGLDRLTFKDAGEPGAAPLVLSGLALRSKQPIALLGPEPEAQPPAELELSGKVAPLIGDFRIGARLAPFAAQPSFELQVLAAGIRGQGLTEVLPALSERIDGAELTDGRFRLDLESHLKVERRGPADLGLGRPFGLDLAIKGLELRNGEAGPVLAGIEELRVEAPRIDPRGGVHIRAIEILKPKGAVERSKEGFHALGLVVKTPEAGAADASAPPAELGPVASPAAPALAPPPPAAPAPELRLDKLTVSGIEFDVRDSSSEPPAQFPFRDLDVDVRGITTLALVEPRPIRFSVSVRGGKVPLKKRAEGGFLGGAFSDAAALVTRGSVEERGIEERELFQEISVAGKLSLRPRLTGWIKVGAAALELSALKGPAAAAGVSLEDGVFDSKLDLRFKGDGSLTASSILLLTDLDVSEPPGGPIFRCLRLPAPLNAVVFALRDENGALFIPVDFTLDAGGVSAGAVADTALSALASVIAGAFANAVKRVALAPISLLDLDGGETPPVEPVALEFAAGDRALSERELAKLKPLIDRVRDDERLVVRFVHELGGGDVAIAAARANPSPEDCVELSLQIRARREGLAAERAAAAADARAYFGAGNVSRAQAAAARVRELERELAQSEAALDSLYLMLRPGADRQAPRRTRDAGLALGRERLAAVREALLRELDGLESRIEPPARPSFTEASGSGGGRVTVAAEIRRAQ
jgi:hypothetical protein